MASNVLDENQYYKLVAGIATLNDCRLLGIDFSERIIRLSGPADAVRFCTEELEGLLGRYQSGQPGPHDSGKICSIGSR